MRSTIRGAIATLIPLFVCALFFAPNASAATYETLELTPTPSPIQPTAFHGTITGPIEIYPSEHWESQRVFCEKGTMTGAFTSASRGTAQQRFSECYVEGERSYPVQTKGAGTAEVVSTSYPILLAYNTAGTAVFVTNPNNEEGPAPTAYVPQVWVGKAAGGPLTGSRLQTIPKAEHIGVPTKTVGLSSSPGVKSYWNEKGTVVKTVPLSWTTFNGWSTTASISGTEQLELSRESAFKLAEH
jgi:hypothetical protein